MTTFPRTDYIDKNGRYVSATIVNRNNWEKISGNYNEHILTPENYFKNLTIPLVCKNCGENIFLYKNNHGSVVLFDCLGKPWSKHDCLNRKNYSAKTNIGNKSYKDDDQYEILFSASSIRTKKENKEVIFVNKEKKFITILIEKLDITSFADCIILGSRKDDTKIWTFSVYDSVTNKSYEITGIEQSIPKAKKRKSLTNHKSFIEAMNETKDEIRRLEKYLNENPNDEDSHSIEKELRRLIRLEKQYLPFQEAEKLKALQKTKKRKRKKKKKLR